MNDAGALKSIEENTRLSAEITEILSSKDGSGTKLRRLKALRGESAYPLSRSHAGYYINKLRKKRAETAKRVTLAAFSAAYFVFTLLRVWWYYRPQRNPFPKTDYTVSDLIVLLYILPAAALAVWGVKKLTALTAAHFEDRIPKKRGRINEER